MNKNNWTLIVAGLLVAALAIYTVCFTVQAGTVGVVYTLGAITESGIKEEPGFYLKWPWPFQSADAKDVRVRLLEVVGKETSTSDQFNVLVTIAAGWKIKTKDVAHYLTAFESDEAARRAVRSEIADARERLVQQIRLIDIINIDPAQRKNYQDVENRIQKLAQSKLDTAGYGIEIAFLKIKRIAFPKETTQKVFARMTSERERRSTSYIEEGKKQAELIKNKAKRDKEIMLSKARRDAKVIRGEGDAAAAEHYKVFKQNPELANFLRRLDALRETLKKRATVVLPAKNTLDEYLIEEPPTPAP